jgi:hypothetical protein
MKLVFKNKEGYSYFFADVPITLKIGTLEDMCLELKIEFYEIGELATNDLAFLMTNLLYFGYITACKESFTKPVYSKDNAPIWFENISQQSYNELASKIQILMGEMANMNKKKVELKAN